MDHEILAYTQWSITQPQGIMTWGLKVMDAIGGHHVE
jgi:hypothetical protein